MTPAAGDSRAWLEQPVRRGQLAIDVAELVRFRGACRRTAPAAEPRPCSSVRGRGVEPTAAAGDVLLIERAADAALPRRAAGVPWRGGRPG